MVTLPPQNSATMHASFNHIRQVAPKCTDKTRGCLVATQACSSRRHPDQFFSHYAGSASLWPTYRQTHKHGFSCSATQCPRSATECPQPPSAQSHWLLSTILVMTCFPLTFVSDSASQNVRQISILKSSLHIRLNKNWLDMKNLAIHI